MRSLKHPAAWLAAAFLLASPGPASAQSEGVTVSGLRNAVEKSYRRMVAGLDLFERRRHLAPGAALRFKLLPRRRDTNMRDIDVAIVADSFETPLAVAPDDTFALPRDAKALKENASVRPNRKKQTMTWRADIRTPGLPPGTRRLGDLRLECEVGMEAGLISNTPPGLAGWLGALLADGPEYCHRPEPRYLFFADRPIFGVTLTSGERTEVVPVDRMYASATRDPDWREELPYCDCEVLLDRTYFMPLGDTSWPDDTLVSFQYMDDSGVAGRSTRADVLAARGGGATVVPFDSGYELWVYRQAQDAQKVRKENRAAGAPWRELVLLFTPSGALAWARVH